MSTIRRIALTVAASAAAATLVMSPSNEAVSGVTTAKDDCMSAWALLAPGDSMGKEAVQGVVTNRRHWDGTKYERGISQSFELSVFDRAFGGGSSVTVAHCGHGATCNELAREVFKAYPNVVSPVVYCTIEPPHIIDNPQSF